MAKRLTDESGEFFKGRVNKQKAYEVYLRLKIIEDSLDELNNKYNNCDRVEASKSEYARGFYNGLDSAVSVMNSNKANPIVESNEAPILPRMRVSDDELGAILSISVVGINTLLNKEKLTGDGNNSGIDIVRLQCLIQGILNRLEVSV